MRTFIAIGIHYGLTKKKSSVVSGDHKDIYTIGSVDVLVDFLKI